METMHPPPLRRNDAILYVHGVPVQINWGAWEVGMSLFIPCVNSSRLIKMMKSDAAARGRDITYHVRIENNILGVRFWRTA